MLDIFWVTIPERVPMDELDDHLPILDEGEREAYRRFKVDVKKVEFMTGRLLLKTLLGEHLGVAPEKVRLERNQYGKPLLPAVYSKNSPSFNLSHTTRVVACTLSSALSVGVDVEDMSEDQLNIMHMVFVPDEIAFVHGFETPAERRKAFYLLWTRKEAVMKAVGKGFSLPPTSFTVPTAWGHAVDANFTYHSLELRDGILCTVALPRSNTIRVPCVFPVGLEDLLKRRAWWRQQTCSRHRATVELPPA